MCDLYEHLQNKPIFIDSGDESFATPDDPEEDVWEDAFPWDICSFLAIRRDLMMNSFE